MDESVMQKHINLYVNQNTLSMGTAGKVAITKFGEIAENMGLLNI
jgi:predicted solute-binding protein